jgi:glycosyltransferase involved in cell wall biosynthesis
MSSPQFSVVIPAYGRPAYLEEAVASVMAQTLQDFECIVVDDHSPEPIVSPVDDDRVRVERLDANRGPAVAMNAGARRAAGRYLVFLDDDDCMTPLRLALAATGLERAPVAVCWSRRLDRPDQAPSGRMLEGDVSAVIREHLTPNIGQTAVRRDDFLPFDETFRASQDVEWWLRLAQAHRVATEAAVGHLYRVHTGERNRNGPVHRVEALQRMLVIHEDYFRRHPRARAFHLKRIGLNALAAGDRRAARRALVRSLLVRPQVRTAWHVARAAAPGSAH